MMHGFQQIVTEAECRYNFVVHGLPPLGDEMAVSPLIWRKKLMDSISGNLDYIRGGQAMACAILCSVGSCCQSLSPLGNNWAAPGAATPGAAPNIVIVSCLRVY